MAYDGRCEACGRTMSSIGCTCGWPWMRQYHLGPGQDYWESIVWTWRDGRMVEAPKQPSVRWRLGFP
jgi:hypothetical protein